MSVRETQKLVRTYDAVPIAVPRARHDLTDFAARAGATAGELDAIRLAVSEALTNVVVHAYHGAGGQLYVSAAVARDELWVLIGDDGSGLHAGPKTGGLGMGLALIADLSDSFAVVNRSSGGTEVRMRFRLQQAVRRSDPRAQSDRGSASSLTRPASSTFSTTT